MGDTELYSNGTGRPPKPSEKKITAQLGQQVSGIELIKGSQWSVVGDNVEMGKLLTRYGHFFHENNPSFLKSTVDEHHINTKDHQPIRSAPYRVSHTERKTIRGQVEEMLQVGIIEPSTSPWPSPLVMVPKSRKKVVPHLSC